MVRVSGDPRGGAGGRGGSLKQQTSERVGGTLLVIARDKLRQPDRD
jgi:GTPase involved in cell partitioning and DNA repair